MGHFDIMKVTYLQKGMWVYFDTENDKNDTHSYRGLLSENSIPITYQKSKEWGG